jgi:flagellin-specific chaperone FliS
MRLMDISINTPALLFPAISLVMLAYTNRYLAIAALARKLHDQQMEDDPVRIKKQIRILRYRLRLVRQMQLFGVLSFLIALGSMYFIYSGNMDAAHYTFATSMIAFVISLVLSLVEIWKSIESVELHLSDISEEDGTEMNDKKKNV